MARPAARGEGGDPQPGGTKQSFIRGGSAPRSKPLLFYTPLLTGKVPLSYTFYGQMVPLSLTKFRTLHPFKLLRMRCLLNNNNNFIDFSFDRKIAVLKQST